MLTGENVIESAEEIQRIREEMHEKFPEVDWPDVYEDAVFVGRLGRELLDTHKAIRIRTNDADRVIDLPTQKYTLVYHEQLAHAMVKASPEEYGKPIIGMQMFGFGERARITLTYPEITDEIVPGDKVSARVIGVNSYDRSLLYGVQFGALQQVCTNGLMAYVMQAAANKRHMGAVGVDAMAATITTAMEHHSEQIGLWQKWAELAVPQASVERVLEELPFSEAEMLRMRDLRITQMDATLNDLQRGNDMTLWNVNSAATQFATHEVKSENRRMELEGQIARAIGKASQLLQ